ncbi:DUF6082 family protein [Streptomyces crystallinus]|uniref:DUF6082 family protein n=1 Tax=Streptomyces crystallinus TaxID=68191 RepID=A0ABP3PZV4_9ACTN
MKLSTLAAFSGMALGAAHLLVTSKRHLEAVRTRSEYAALTTGLMHQRWLAQGIERPELTALWSGFPELSESERALHLHINGVVSLWWLQYFTGVINSDQVAHLARTLMESEDGRRYWERAGAYRTEEDGGRVQAHTFNELISFEYAKAKRTPQKAAAEAS